MFFVHDGTLAGLPIQIPIFIRPIADLPWLNVNNSMGYEDPVSPIPLNIEAGVSDYDGSETPSLALCNCFVTDFDGDGVPDRCGKISHHQNH